MAKPGTTVMHLFPRSTSKSECGVYGIMTNRVEFVTCKNCLEKYNMRGAERVDVKVSGDANPSYDIGLASAV